MLPFLSLSLFFVFCLFRAAPTAYGVSQTRGWIGATSATYTTALGNTGSLTHWARPGIKPATSWFLVGFVSAAPWQELQSIVDLQCCANSCCTAKWPGHTHTHSLSSIIFHHGLSQETGYSSLCYIVGSHCLSILNIIVCISNSQSLSLPFPSPLTTTSLFCMKET